MDGVLEVCDVPSVNLKMLSVLAIVGLAGCATIPAVNYPITKATGKYTIRVAFFIGQGESSAAKLAGEVAEVYRKTGHEAYVTDLCNRAILSVGSFDDKDDPALRETWRREYEKYRKRRGGRESVFQEQLDSFHGGQSALGDRPWPISIELLQMRMKRAQGKISAEEMKLYLESLAAQPKSSYGDK